MEHSITYIKTQHEEVITTPYYFKCEGCSAFVPHQNVQLKLSEPDDDDIIQVCCKKCYSV